MAIKTRDVFAVHVVSGVATDVHQELRGGAMAAFEEITCVIGGADGAMRIANVVLPADADAKTVKASVDRVQQNNFQRQLHSALS